MKTLFSYLIIPAILLTSCVGDDFVDDAVDPILRIVSTVETIELGQTYQFEAMYLNNVGQEESAQIVWQTSDVNKLTIDANGLAEAHEPGKVTVTATFTVNGQTLSDDLEVEVGEETIQTDVVRTGIIEVTSNYVLRGNFSMTQVDDNLVLSIDDTYRASSGLPGLYIYLTNNPSTTSGAFEIGAVDVFDGAHEYVISDQNVGINDYDYILYFCKPFNVKIGEGKFEE